MRRRLRRPSVVSYAEAIADGASSCGTKPAPSASAHLLPSSIMPCARRPKYHAWRAACRAVKACRPRLAAPARQSAGIEIAAPAASPPGKMARRRLPGRYGRRPIWPVYGRARRWQRRISRNIVSEIACPWLIGGGECRKRRRRAAALAQYVSRHQTHGIAHGSNNVGEEV